MRVCNLLAAALLSFGLGLGAAAAQSYPNRVIKVIVPFTPGSPVDAAARVITQHLQVRLGQNIIVENRPGAGTTIGTKAAALAPPDGYTLLFVGPNFAYSKVLYPNLDFDPPKSFTPVAATVAWSHVMVVANDIPAKTVAELVAHAKANPGKLVFGYGLGTTPHILGESFQRAAGVEFTRIPYRGGEQARADLLGGRVHINIAPVPTLLPLIRDGKARPLAFTGPRRNHDLPDVPTMRESGLPQVGYDPDVWLGFFTPVGTPAEVIDKLNREVNEVLKSPEMTATLARLGFEAMITTPQQFAHFVEAEMHKWPPLLLAAGLKPEQ